MLLHKPLPALAALVAARLAPVVFPPALVHPLDVPVQAVLALHVRVALTAPASEETFTG